MNVPDLAKYRGKPYLTTTIVLAIPYLGQVHRTDSDYIPSLGHRGQKPCPVWRHVPRHHPHFLLACIAGGVVCKGKVFSAYAPISGVSHDNKETASPHSLLGSDARTSHKQSRQLHRLISCHLFSRVSEPWKKKCEGIGEGMSRANAQSSSLQERDGSW